MRVRELERTTTRTTTQLFVNFLVLGHGMCARQTPMPQMSAEDEEAFQCGQPSVPACDDEGGAREHCSRRFTSLRRRGLQPLPFAATPSLAPIYSAAGFSLPGACSATIGVRTQPPEPLLGRSECCQCATSLQSDCEQHANLVILGARLVASSLLVVWQSTASQGCWIGRLVARASGL